MSAEKRIHEVLEILRGIGFPLGKDTDFATPLRQRRVANILMGVANLRPDQPFSEISYDDDGKHHYPRTRDLIRFINQHYGENIADSSYDDIRRKNLDFLVEAGLVVRSANRPGAPTNDGTRGYAVAKDAVELFTKYGKPGWRRTLEKWKKEKGCLATKLARPRKQHLVPVRLPDGSKVDLSKGKHNELQKRIIEDFLPRFLLDPELLYLGDTANKILIHEKERLIEIGLAEFNHDTLPDIVVLDKKQNWVYFIEAVHSSNPISRIRHLKLEKLSSGCSLGKVFVSAFLDRNSFRKWISEISWETEVWLASEPSHMIHFNGDRFMGPHDTVDN